MARRADYAFAHFVKTRRPHEHAAGVPLVSPLLRIGTSKPSARASVSASSTWHALLHGPSILRFEITLLRGPMRVTDSFAANCPSWYRFLCTESLYPLPNKASTASCVKCTCRALTFTTSGFGPSVRLGREGSFRGKPSRELSALFHLGGIFCKIHI